MHMNLHRFPLFLLLMAGLSCLAPAQDSPNASAETMDPGPFYGFWELQEPAGDKCVVIIKRGGRLSCFWSGSSRAIQKGTWVRQNDILTAVWESGHKDVFRKLGENAIERESFDPGMSLLAEPVLTIRGVRVDSRIPGSLTTDNDPTEREPSAASPDNPEPVTVPMRNAYIGFWKIDQSTGLLGIGGGEPHFFLHLQRNGDAQVALRDWEGDQGVRGQWRIGEDRVVITWPNNRRDVLRQSSDGYLLETYRPKDDLSDNPRNRSEAVKVPASDAERYFDAGNFNRLTVVDIRGTWIPEESTGRREYISIEGWGKAFRYPPATGGTGADPGNWRLLNDRVVVTWVDGAKDILRFVFPDFVQESYTADEPLTGTPHRVIPIKKVEDKD